MSLDFVRITRNSLLVRFGDQIDTQLSARIVQIAGRLPEGVIDAIPSYTTLLIRFDPDETSFSDLEQRVQGAWDADDQSAPVSSTHHVIPVAYGGHHGPDLARVAQHTGLTADEVIRRHSNARYTVGAIGFSPGFGFLTGLPAELESPRITTPRLRVPAGTVAIGGKQTGVYPVESAGGWNLIGRTDVVLFDPNRDEPSLLRNGDTVTFLPTREIRIDPGPVVRSIQPRHRGLLVTQPGLQTTLQDGGRAGMAHLGVSTGGALDQQAMQRGNRIVGNDPDAAVLEITLTGPSLVARQGMTVAFTGEGPAPLINGDPVSRNRALHVYLGDEITFAPIQPDEGARGYLAVAGGFDVPIVLSSRSTDLQSGIGGIDGRALQTGDVLTVGRPIGKPVFATQLVSNRNRHTVRVVAGPQREYFDAQSWENLCSIPFKVSNEANRIGVRLEGRAFRRINTSDMISEGITIGSIQVPGSGQPIVLLRGCATIGGYPKIATVIEEDLDLCGQWKPGDVVRFQEVTNLS